MSEAKRFVVSQVDWAKDEYSDDPYFRRTPRMVRVTTFLSFDVAEYDRRQREVEFRNKANPFHYGGEALFYQTSLDAPRLHDWLMDVGIEPPANPNSHSAWMKWWDANIPIWNADQLSHAWAAFDKVRFFEVNEENRTKAYVIIELNWTWQDEPTLYADHEGGNIVRAFRSKEAAEQECDRLNRARQAQTEHNGFHYFTRSSRSGSSNGTSHDISETVFFEVVEIEVEDRA